MIPPLEAMAVGIVVERSRGAGLWVDFLWRPVSALGGAPDTRPWTKLSDDGERATFFAGTADIELYRSEAGNYRENLLVEKPLLWVALRPSDADPPYMLAGVTVDPAEGKSWWNACSTKCCETKSATTASTAGGIATVSTKSLPSAAQQAQARPPRYGGAGAAPAGRR